MADNMDKIENCDYRRSLPPQDQLCRFLIGFFFSGLLLFIIGCSNDGNDTGITNTADNSVITDELDDLEQDVHQQVNQYRLTQNLSPLEWNETIADYCRSHSLDMAAGTVPFGHQGFEGRVAGIGQTLSYESAAENVAYNNFADSVTTAVQGWLDSPGHLANIQGEFNLTGVGVAQSDEGSYYFTQMFFRQ
jgi:uncharacterized protein YkwD